MSRTIISNESWVPSYRQMAKEQFSEEESAYFKAKGVRSAFLSFFFLV